MRQILHPAAKRAGLELSETHYLRYVDLSKEFSSSSSSFPNFARNSSSNCNKNSNANANSNNSDPHQQQPSSHYDHKREESPATGLEAFQRAADSCERRVAAAAAAVSSSSARGMDDFYSNNNCGSNPSEVSNSSSSEAAAADDQPSWRGCLACENTGDCRCKAEGKCSPRTTRAAAAAAARSGEEQAGRRAQEFEQAGAGEHFGQNGGGQVREEPELEIREVKEADARQPTLEQAETQQLDGMLKCK